MVGNLMRLKEAVLRKPAALARLSGVALFSLLCGLSAEVVAAESLSDPTRPPAMAGGAEQGGDSVEPSGPVLQSVLISPGRSVAVISGQTVRLGEKYGDARLVKITESQALLKNGNDIQTLRLFPDVEKRQVSSKARLKVNARRKITEDKE